MSPALSRRELVAGFLGAAVASAACRRRPARRPIPGVIVDRAFTAGHWLREAAPRPGGEPQEVEVAIVGGGIAGLSAAWRLAAAGVSSFAVLELDEEVGGTSRSGSNAVSAFPWGAHYLPAPLADEGPTARLLRELGLLVGHEEDGSPRYAEQALVAEPEERVFYKGHWYEGLYLHPGASADDLRQLERFEKQMQAFAAARDGKGRRAFAVPTATGSDDAEWTGLDRLSMAAWMDGEGYTSPRLRWYVDYACRDDYGATSGGVSAWAAIWYFAARQHGDGRRHAGYLSWPEGNGHLVDHLARAAGAERIWRKTLVHSVNPGPNGVLVHACDATTRSPRTLRAQQVIFAGPRFVARQVLEPWRASPPSFLAEFRYSPWVVANLTVRQALPARGFPTAWDNVFYESKSLGYVVATHQAPRAIRSGPTVLSWYYPLTGADEKAERARAQGASYEDWEALVSTDLRLAHPEVDGLAERLEVMRWGHAMVRPRPGFIWGGARQQAQESLGNRVHFAHSDLGGMALFEEANWFGVRAAERALAGLGRGGSSWL